MTSQEWLSWLESQNITVTNGLITRPQPNASAKSDVSMTLLGHERLLTFSGTDNRKFLQGQVTCDVVKLPEGEVVLGACCTPKGRMVANFRIVAQGDDLIAVLPADQSDYLKTHLSKYAAFFRTVAITDTTDRWLRIGLSGSGAAEVITHLTEAESAREADKILPWSQGLVVPVAADRFELWLNPDAAQTVWQELAAQAAIVATSHWQLEDIQQGIAWVTEASRESWIPQHLNWQALNGISFKKGCYTGQEIVARMKYLGKLKSHLYRFTAEQEQAPAIGTGVLNGSGKKIGDVVVALSAGSSTVEILAVVRKDDAENGSLVLAEQNIALTRQPLPYTVED